MENLRQSWRNLPLATRLVGLSGMLVVIVALAVTAFTIQREQTSLRAGLENQASLLLDVLNETMRDHIYNLEINNIQETARVVDDEDFITRVIVYDPKGVVLVDSTLAEQLPMATPTPLGQLLVRRTPLDSYFEWGQTELVAGRSVVVGNQTIGAISIGLSTARLDEDLRNLVVQGFAIAVLMAALAIFVTAYVTRQITHPLSDLTQAAGQMASGDLSIHVPQETRDEVGRLAGAFNRMAVALERRESELRRLNESLEGQVEQRTAELRRQNEELIVARRQAEEATRLKSQFLATMSHELRTPLNAIMGYSQLLLLGATGDLSEAQHQNVDRILKSGEDLLKLINDILDLAKIEAGRTEIIQKPFVLKEWIDGIQKQMEGLAQDKQLEFEVRLDKELPETLIGDPDRLRQIAANLISNAIKFTEKGGVKVLINRHSRDAWTLVVEDTGIGIASHALEYIFDEFRQVDDTMSRQFGGTGLGLAIVRNLALMMGGNVRAQSTVGKGSTFTVQLPLIVEKAPAGAA
jgi:signal transduction histidine kinase